MTLAEHICARFAAKDIPTRIEREFLWVTIGGEEKKVRLDPDWEEAFAAYIKARSRDFNDEDLSFTLNNSITFPLVRLDLEGYRESSDTFIDGRFQVRSVTS
ncbi:MAG: hypothetical protein WBO95_00860 [Candidatus Dechloromonas phosphoritropha]|jgi:hypothetical protein